MGFFSVNVAMDFQKNLPADFGDHEPAIDKCDGSAERDLAVERRDIVGMRPYAAMGLKLIDARRGDRAVNAVAADAEPQPVFSQRIVGAGGDASRYGFTRAAHLLLDRWRNMPSGVFPFFDNPEFACRGGPVMAAQSHRKTTDQPAFSKVKKHTLGDINQDPVAKEMRRNVAVIDAQLLSDLQERA